MLDNTLVIARPRVAQTQQEKSAAMLAMVIRLSKLRNMSAARATPAMEQNNRTPQFLVAQRLRSDQFVTESRLVLV